MEKKIIAIVSVVILLASVLTACGKVKTITLKEGQEYPLATDKEGNTIVNDDGNLVVYVTDENGKYVKDENGERATAAVTFPDQVINKNVLETPDYVMTFPEDWEIDGNGRAYKGDNDKAIVQIHNLGSLKEGETFDTVIKSMTEGDENSVSQIENLGFKVTTFKMKREILTYKKLECIVYGGKIEKSDGAIYMYNEYIYFMFKDELYKAEYSCQEGGYDETVNIVSIIDNGLVMKDKKMDKKETE